MMTEEQIIARLLAVRLDKPPALPAPPPPKPAEVRAEERWSEDNKSTPQVINEFADKTDALTRRLRQEEDARARYQLELDRAWQRKLDLEAELNEGYDYSTGFMERRRTSCHCGPGDSDWRLR
jgi:hypothetical protein